MARHRAGNMQIHKREWVEGKNFRKMVVDKKFRESIVDKTFRESIVGKNFRSGYCRWQKLRSRTFR